MDARERAMSERVRKVWEARLGSRDFGVEGNFFEIGGTSRIIAAVRADLIAELGRDIPLVAFYQNQNIHTLARYLLDGDSEPRTVPDRVRRSGGSRRQRELRAAARAARTEG